MLLSIPFVYGLNTITFRYAKIGRPESSELVGNQTENRSVCWDKLEIDEVTDHDSAVQQIDVGTVGGRFFLQSGFSGDEKNSQLDFCWSEGPESEVTV